MSYNKLANVQYSRLKNKIISGVGEEPTIPIIATAFAGVTEEDYMVLNQFTPNDVLDGEFVINTTDDRIWVRSDDSILEVMTSASVALPSLTNNHIWIGDNGTASEYALGAGFTVSGATISIDANYDNLYIESTGLYSTIRKDVGHSSTGDHSVISGGCCNTINGVTNASSIVGGGQHVIATASYSSILGGASNDMLNNIYGVVGGGAANSLFNSCSSTILNGTNNRLLSGTYSHISNGALNTVYGCHNIIGNGNNNTVSGQYSSIGNGVQNKLDNSPFSTVLNGAQNTISSSYFSSVIAGNNSKIYNSYYSFILGGNNNTTSGYFNVIPGGTLNTVEGSFSRAQGSTNKIFSDYSTADGFNNCVNGAFSSVNGSTNVINSNFSSIRGTNNTVSSNYTHVLGNGITATYSNHTYVNNLIIEETPNVNDEENTNILVRNTLTGQIETSTFSSTSMTRETNYLIKNQTGSTLLKGKVVRADGTLGSSGRILGDYMIADGTIPAKFTLGIVKNDILNGEDGYVAEFGLVKGINTTGTPYGEVWNDGDVLWASPTASGGLTNQEPLTPNLHIEMAIVIDADSNGSIFVRPHRYPYSYDLQDMGWTASSENDKDIIQYDSTLGYFTLTNEPEFNSITAVTISATAFYGDGSNLTGISAPSLYTGSGTVPSGTTASLTDTLTFQGNGGLILNNSTINNGTGLISLSKAMSNNDFRSTYIEGVEDGATTNYWKIFNKGSSNFSPNLGIGFYSNNLATTGTEYTLTGIRAVNSALSISNYSDTTPRFSLYGGTTNVTGNGYIKFWDYNAATQRIQIARSGLNYINPDSRTGGNGSIVLMGDSLVGSELISLQNRTAVKGADTLSTSTAFEIYDGDTTPTKLWDFRNNGDVYSSGTGVIYGAITVDSGGNTPFTIRRNNSSVNNSLFFPQQLKNSSGSYVDYSQFATKILTNTASSESGQFTINLKNNGSNVAIFDSGKNNGTILNVSHSTGQKFAVSGFITIDSTGQTTIEGGGTRTLAVKRANTTGSTGIHFDNSVKTSGEIYTSYAGGNATNMTFTLDNGSGLTTIFQLTPTNIVLSKDLNGNGNRILNTIVNPTVQEITSTGTLTINATNEISGIVTAQAGALTIANPTGTPVQDQKLKFRIKDNGTARAITWGTNFRAIGVTLPTTTTASKVLVVGCFWNSNDSKWDVIAVNEEA